MSRTILIVDDSPPLCKMLSHQLNFHGFIAPCSMSAKEAMLHLASDPLPDLIMMDIMMPEIDGFELLRTVRADPRIAHLPVIMYSAYDDPTYRATASAAGASDYWVKGKIDFERMKTDIEQVIQGESKTTSPAVA